MQDLETTIQKVQQFTSTYQLTAISNDTELRSTSDILAVIKDKQKKLETMRKEFTSDLNAQLKKINNRFKDASEPLEQLEKALKLQITIYYDKQRKEAEAKLAAERSAAVESDNKSVVAVESPSSTVRTDLATTSIKRVWTFEIDNEYDVPREYLCVDEKKIRDAIRDGKREIPGVKIFQESQVAIR